jgi:hypothetical protein
MNEQGNSEEQRGDKRQERNKRVRGTRGLWAPYLALLPTCLPPTLALTHFCARTHALVMAGWLGWRACPHPLVPLHSPVLRLRGTLLCGRHGSPSSLRECTLAVCRHKSRRRRRRRRVVIVVVNKSS